MSRIVKVGLHLVRVLIARSELKAGERGRRAAIAMLFLQAPKSPAGQLVINFL